MRRKRRRRQTASAGNRSTIERTIDATVEGKTKQSAPTSENAASDRVFTQKRPKASMREAHGDHGFYDERTIVVALTIPFGIIDRYVLKIRDHRYSIQILERLTLNKSIDRSAAEEIQCQFTVSLNNQQKLNELGQSINVMAIPTNSNLQQ
jgi:hypothetical protein